MLEQVEVNEAVEKWLDVVARRRYGSRRFVDACRRLARAYIRAGDDFMAAQTLLTAHESQITESDEPYKKYELEE